MLRAGLVEDLRGVRAAATLVAALPRGRAVVAGDGGWRLVVGGAGTGAQLPTCHLRAAVGGALATGDRGVLVDRLGAPAEGALRATLVLDPDGPVASLGGGVHQVEGRAGRHLLFVTDLAPALAKSAIVQAATVPRCPVTGDELVLEHLSVQTDAATGISLVAVADAGHPARAGLVADAMLAMAAACYVEELGV